MPPGVHRITQSIDTTFMPDCKPHSYTANDDCVNDSQLEAYLYMMCSAGDRADCPPAG